MPRFARRHSVMVAALLVGVAVAFPLGVLASHSFTDVPDGVFHDDIDAIADAGVTTGCGGGKFCPKDYVTREQMAAFLNRLGALGPGKTPVVNADKVDGHDDVLPVGAIEIAQQGPWLAVAGSPVTIRHHLDVTTISRVSDGAGSIQLALQAPGTIAGVTFGLKSVEVCFAASVVVIDVTHAAQSMTTSLASVILNTTNRSMASAACYTIVDPSPQAPVGGTNLLLVLAFPAGATASIGNVTSTWTPVR